MLGVKDICISLGGEDKRAVTFESAKSEDLCISLGEERQKSSDFWE